MTDYDPFDPKVAVVDAGGSDYPKAPPYHPDENYPEYPFDSGDVSQSDNRAYRAVREGFKLLGLDASNFGTPEWNPLADVIRPGDRVVLKPNFVQHVNYSEKDYNSVVVHGSVIRAVLDYAWKALKGEGTLVVADAPLWDADFNEIVRRIGLDKVIDFYSSKGIKVELMDLRRMTVVQENGLVVKRQYRGGEERKYRIIDLNGISAFSDFEQYSSRLNGMDYDRMETVRHHSNGRHEYCVSQEILDADVLISMPKLKTHKKAGVTLAMKNLVGVNVDKNFLPHYRIGTPSEGGDEYPDVHGFFRKAAHKFLRFCIDTLLMRAERIAVPLLKPLFKVIGWINRKVQRNRPEVSLPSTHPGYNQMVINSVYKFLLGSEIRAGNWEGNDTIWRMILDLNQIAMYADKDGKLADKPSRRIFVVLDGIVGGEGDGPMNPDPVYGGALLCGFNAFHVDRAAVRLMGLREEKVKTVSMASKAKRPLYDGRDTVILSNKDEWKGNIEYKHSLKFKPHYAWPSIAGGERQ